MKHKKKFTGCLGDVADSILSDPIEKKKPSAAPSANVDDIIRLADQQPLKKNRPAKRDETKKNKS